MSLLPQREHRPFAVPARHTVLDAPLEGPWPKGAAVAYFGMGCFWGAERIFWQLPGVISTAVGYQGGQMSYPCDEKGCSGLTEHGDLLLVVYAPLVLSNSELTRTYFAVNDPTQGNRQAGDMGCQKRSAIFWTTPG